MKKRLLMAAVATGILSAGMTVSGVSAAEVEVHKGDSLWGISQEHNTTVEQLMTLNNLESTTIHPNQIIMTDEKAQTEYYTVKKGDTLSGIGNEFGVSVTNLKSWNGLNSDLIVIGEELAVNGETTEPSAEPKKAEPKQQEKVEVEQEPVAEASTGGETITVTATAYTAKCVGCTGITATGVDLNNNPNAKVIAVDPNVIPLGSKVHVEGYGDAIAADTGGAIKGNKIDIHVPSKDEAYEWGVQKVEVTIVD